MSSPFENQNWSNNSITNSRVQHTSHLQQLHAVNQAAQISHYPPPWHQFNQMFGFGPRSYSDIAFMQSMMSIAAMNPTLTVPFQSAMQHIGLPRLMTGSFWGTSYPMLSNNLDPSPMLSDLLSESGSTVTAGTDDNENVGAVAQMANADPPLQSPLDFTMESPLTSWSSETNVHTSTTGEMQVTSNTKFADDQEPVSSYQVDLLLENEPSPQDNVLDLEVVNEKQQGFEEEKLVTPSDSSGVKAVDYYKKLLFTCDIPDCKRKFKTFDRLRRHFACHNKEKNFDCSFCDKSFSLKIHLVHHMKSHRTVIPSDMRREEKNYDCDFCEEKIDGKVLLRHHVEDHMKMKDDDIAESSCVMTSATTSSVEMEQFDFRPNFGCRIPGCGKFYPDIRQFNAHFQSEHNIDPSVRAKRSYGKEEKKPSRGRGRPSKNPKKNQTEEDTGRPSKNPSKNQTEEEAGKKFPCPRCDKPFSRQVAMEKHLCWDH